MKSFIRKLLVGDNVISEYSKIRIPGEIHEKVYMETKGDLIDISQCHWLLCIEPVVFGMWIKKDEKKITYRKDEQYHLYFFDSGNNIVIKKNALAVLKLIFFDSIEEDDGILLLLRLRESKIYHLNFLKRYLLFSRYYKKGSLTFSKFKSFVAAYTYPRRIRLISFRQDNYYNIFPMDLLGDIRECKRYVFGLRHTNVSLPGIIETGKLVVSEVSFKYKDIIYELGKHHSSKPPSLDSLAFNILYSKSFEFYVPDWVNSYKEVKILKTKNLGSHMLLWGEPLQENIITETNSHLFLIHFFEYLHQKNRDAGYILV